MVREALSEQMTFEQRPDRVSKAATWGGCRYRGRNNKYLGPGGTGVAYSKYSKKPNDRGSEIRSGRETEARSVRRCSLGQRITPGLPTIPFFSTATLCSI